MNTILSVVKLMRTLHGNSTLSINDDVSQVHYSAGTHEYTQVHTSMHIEKWPQFLKTVAPLEPTSKVVPLLVVSSTLNEKGLLARQFTCFIDANLKVLGEPAPSKVKT